MRGAATVALLVLAAGARAELTPGAWRTLRPVTPPPRTTTGLVYLPLDDDALSVGSLSEFRIAGAGNREVAYRILREDGEPLLFPVAVRAIGARSIDELVADVAPSGAPQLRLTLGGTSLGNLIEDSVRVDASVDRRAWSSARILASGRSGASLVVTVPGPRGRYLRVRWRHLPGKSAQITHLSADAATPVARRLVVVGGSLRRSERAAPRRSVLDVDLGRRIHGLAQVALDIAEPAFDRRATVQALRGDAAKVEAATEVWGDAPPGRLRRVTGAGDTAARLPDAAARLVRVTVENGDDPPLTIRAVTVRRLGRGLVFEARPGERYSLWYGRKDAAAPDYEFARLPLPVAPADLPRCTLGPEVSRPTPAPPEVPWTRRYPWALWTALLAIVAFLLAGIARSMRSMAGR